jgi:uncharacterized iron-regulated membrane protein
VPLIFQHEIAHLTGTAAEPPAILPADAGASRAKLDPVLAVAPVRHPDRVLQFVSRDEDDDRLWFVTLTPTPDSAGPALRSTASTGTSPRT